MDAKRILAADVLDIIFDQRNKDYGAYDLRKNYRRRLAKALSATFLFAALFCLSYVLMSAIKKPDDKLVITGPDVDLKKVEPPVDKPIETPPPPKTIDPPKIKMLQFTPPRIVQEDVPEDQRPPENNDLEEAKIGTITTDGTKDDGLVSPPVDEGKGVVEIPKKQEDQDIIFTKVEIESKYPGGVSAWARFLGRQLESVNVETEGKVIVRFIVDAEGNVSNVEAISGPEELRPIAIAAIKKSGVWEPAIQNGKKVKSYKSQPITFKLPE